MSYTQIFQKTFLAIQENKNGEMLYFPLVLMGDSSLSDYSEAANRWIMQREWFPLIIDREEHRLVFTEQQMLDYIDKHFGSGEIRYGNKWYNKEAMHSFIHSGCLHARDFDEIIEHDYRFHKVYGSICLAMGHDKKMEDDHRSLSHFCKNGEELRRMIVEMEAWMEEANADHCPFMLSFETNFTGLKMERKKNLETKRPDTYYVLYLPAHMGYFMKMSSARYWYSNYPNQAKWFKTELAAKRYLEKYENRFKGRMAAEIKAITATT